MQVDKLPIIKQEDCFEETYFYCLNPFCTDSNNRKFLNQDRHFIRQQCKKWIVGQKVLIVENRLPFHAKDIANITIDFENHPLVAFQILAKLNISGWQKILEDQQKKIKKELNRAIEVQFETVKSKIHQIINNNCSFFDNISTTVTSQEEPSQILNIFYSRHLQKLKQLKNRVLFKKVHFKQTVAEIKQNIQKIFESIVEQKAASQGFLAHQQQRNFHQFIFEQTTEYYNKLQVLCSALKKKQSLFTVQNEKMSLQCCLCSRKVQSDVNPSTKKSIKKKLAEQILFHFYSNHYEQVGFAYCQNVSKSFLVDLKFEEFLSLSKKHKQITIVDRQSGIMFEQKYEDWRKCPLNFIIEIISIKNVGMARGKHILVQNHLSIDCLIAIISYICTQRDQNVEILTKKTSLIKGIEDLLWCKTLKVQQ